MKKIFHFLFFLFFLRRLGLKFFKSPPRLTPESCGTDTRLNAISANNSLRESQFANLTRFDKFLFSTFPLSVLNAYSQTPILCNQHSPS